MNERARALREQLIRNIDELPKERELRPPLYDYLSVSTQERPEIVEYPDSGKFLATSGARGGPRFARMSRLDEDLDYWEGEP